MHRFGHNHTQVKSALKLSLSNAGALHKVVSHFIMTQMTATAGIKKHGDKAVSALMSEFTQLDSKSVFTPVDATKLTRAQKRAALRAIKLIKEKRCGKIKGKRKKTFYTYNFSRLYTGVCKPLYFGTRYLHPSWSTLILF